MFSVTGQVARPTLSHVITAKNCVNRGRVKSAYQYRALRRFTMRLYSSRGLAIAAGVLSMLVFGVPFYVGGADTGSGQSSGSTSQEPKGPPPRGHKPPPEAYKVCEGKTAGTAAQLTSPRGDVIKGVCRQMDGEMVLIPDFDKDGKGARPPKRDE
jgi:hypothetical protein